MGTLILLLQAFLLLFGFVFSESSESLQCFNDYDTELKCSLTPAESETCSEYRLKALIETHHRFFHFEETHLGTCECRIDVPGFVIGEDLKINLWKEGKIWRLITISTGNSIKPRRPIITSVVQKANRDILVTVNTTYTKQPFSDYLMVELNYKIDGSDEKETTLLQKASTVHEILVSNLQPNSRYVLRARVKSSYSFNHTFSDYSGPIKFQTQSLQCFNDYDTELKCSLTPAESEICSKYRLNALIETHNRLVGFCHFEESHLGTCECRIDFPGFVIGEDLKINLSKGDNVWWPMTISTVNSIKPRRPIITSVVQKANRDILIEVNTTYTKQPFSDYLMVELNYKIDGSDEKETTLLQKASTVHEILGRNLQPNSRYVLRARVKSSYSFNHTFSDYSDPIKFQTPISLQNTLKIIIPILCLILIICISSIYFWFYSLESCEVQDQDRHYGLILKKDVDSAPLIYSTTCYESVDENSSEKVRLEREKDHGPLNIEQAFENKYYWQSGSSGMSKPAVSNEFTNVLSENFLVSSKNLDPKIYTDVNYCVWDGCTDSGTSKMVDIIPTNEKMDVVFGYPNISWSNPIIDEPFSSKKLQDVTICSHDRIVMPADEEYQAF
ncbi:hypothetical protein C0J50_6471 [Silurus asotus]|uniref:Fibronectin type-III domain-containing protein n=1 Tax=Silurus asotus TaxID=30991 RepID=A0AAD5A477_SILAS|nr:hypothetical protein C0J50_6471 [Silurus asotus]